MPELHFAAAKTFVGVSGQGLGIRSLWRKSIGAVLDNSTLRTRQREGRMGDLVQLVDNQIIPNLMRAHAQEDHAITQPERSGYGFDALDIDTFADLAIAGRVDTLMEFIAVRVAAGASMDSLYEGLIAPAERRLEAWWRDDQCVSADVTIGTCVLKQVLRELSFDERTSLGTEAHTAFFSALPGEAEPFGLRLTEAAFEHSGWRTWTEPATSCAQITRAVRSNWFDLMGLVVDNSKQLEQAPEIVTAVHEASKNRAISVILCGRIFQNQPELSAAAGADGGAGEGMAAVAAAQAMLRRTANDP